MMFKRPLKDPLQKHREKKRPQRLISTARPADIMPKLDYFC